MRNFNTYKIMEMNEITNAWDQYNNSLDKNLSIDEDKLRLADLDKAKDQMEYPLASEMVELIGGLLVIAAVLLISLVLIDDPKYFLFGLITVTIGAVYVGLSLIKIRLLKRVNYYDTPIVKLQRELAYTRRRFLKFRAFERLLFPLYLLPMLPLTSKLVSGIDLFTQIPLFAMKFAGVLGVVYLIIFFIHKHLYDKRFRAVENIITRLKEFEKE